MSVVSLWLYHRYPAIADILPGRLRQMRHGTVQLFRMCQLYQIFRMCHCVSSVILVDMAKVRACRSEGSIKSDGAAGCKQAGSIGIIPAAGIKCKGWRKCLIRGEVC